jgi:Ssp1 endopeptidase immunity protein Rap1a
MTQVLPGYALRIRFDQKALEMNTLKIAMSLSVVLLAPLSAAGADPKPHTWTSAADLVERCNTMEQFSAGECAGYVVGVAEIADSGYLKGYRSCIPAHVNKGQLADAVRKYIAKHPEYQQYVGYQVVVMALVESFPCEKQ